ncbi:hypothetical protein Gotri_004241, partial [Gossypium trilobum]|nr:hypothetical protein [Gossypium trilobum]
MDSIFRILPNKHFVVFITWKNTVHFDHSSSLATNSVRRLQPGKLALPDSEELQPIQLGCNSRYKDHGMHQLHVGEDYQFGVEEKALHFCEAISGRQIASWHAYQPRRDWNHKAVFWRVKENGFFLSWDNSSW